MRLGPLPLWLKYVLTLCVFVPLIVVAVLYIRSESPAPSAKPPAAVVTSAQTARIVVERDQAVHRAVDLRSVAPAVALERAILADVRSRIAHHDIAGPAGQVKCDPLPSPHTGRLPFRCHALAGGFSYPFRGVVDPRRHTLAWCKDDNISTAGSPRVPLSPACTR